MHEKAQKERCVDLPDSKMIPMSPQCTRWPHSGGGWHLPTFFKGATTNPVRVCATAHMHWDSGSETELHGSMSE